MHEIKIAEDLSAIVLETAKRENLSRITKVSIAFGRLVQVVPDIFEFAFRESVRDTVAENASVDFEIVPVTMSCQACGTRFRVNENNFSCEACGSQDLKILTGKELFVKSIEGE